jgi:alpha-tubulin suppressor-like RCC1 family protein
VTVNGTQGTAGAYTRIVVSRTAPTPLYYYCTAHSGMGDSINITNQLQGNVTGNVTGSITGLAGSVTSGGNIHIGVITATSYSGDGSNMTGIAATNYNTQTVTANASETIIDLSDGNMITMNQSANTTVGFASTSTAMDITIIRVKDANDTARTITWPDSVNWNGGSAPTLINDSASGDSQQFQLITRDSGLTWYGWEPFAYDGPYTNSTLYTWGSNSYGMLGQNGNVPNYHGISSPTQIGSAEKWIPYASRDGHKSSQVNGAINMDGELWVFGDNRYGGLGQGDRTERSSPVQVDGTTWDSSCKFAYGFLARTTDGELWSWGNNQNGMLGLNQAGPNSISSPTQIPGTTWSKNINITATFANGVKTDGTMWMWGSSSSGSLGQNQGPGNNRSSPVQVGTDTTWATGYQKSSVTDSCICAVKTDGTLWSWGYSGTQGHGQSLNPNANRSSPIQIPGTTWDTVSGSYRGFGAVKTDGSLWVWGNNYYGQLGQNANGNPAARSSPMQIPGTTWSKISGDVNGYFALKTDGTAWAWGRSDKGQLGINNTTSYSSPVQIPGTDWTGVVSAGMAVLGYKDAT